MSSGLRCLRHRVRHRTDNDNKGGCDESRFEFDLGLRAAGGMPGPGIGAWQYRERPAQGSAHDGGGRVVRRSAEHKSELQSLMRISYDVFCLKKKKPTIT